MYPALAVKNIKNQRQKSKSPQTSTKTIQQLNISDQTFCDQQDQLQRYVYKKEILK